MNVVANSQKKTQFVSVIFEKPDISGRRKTTIQLKMKSLTDLLFRKFESVTIQKSQNSRYLSCDPCHQHLISY